MPCVFAAERIDFSKNVESVVSVEGYFCTGPWRVLSVAQRRRYWFSMVGWWNTVQQKKHLQRKKMCKLKIKLKYLSVT